MPECSSSEFEKDLENGAAAGEPAGGGDGHGGGMLYTVTDTPPFVACGLLGMQVRLFFAHVCLTNECEARAPARWLWLPLATSGQE